MNKISLIDWVKTNIPTNAITNVSLQLLSIIDQILINNLNGLIISLNTHYTLTYNVKFFFNDNEIHIVIEWLFNDSLLGEKKIGDSILIVSLDDYAFETNGNLFIDVKDITFTSQNLIDFKSIVANLTLKIQYTMASIIKNVKQELQNVPKQPTPTMRGSGSGMFNKSPTTNFFTPRAPVVSAHSNQNLTRGIPSSTRQQQQQPFKMPSILQNKTVPKQVQEQKIDATETNATVSTDELNIKNEEIYDDDENEQEITPTITETSNDDTSEIKSDESKEEDDSSLFVPNVKTLPKIPKIPTIPKMKFDSIKGKLK